MNYIKLLSEMLNSAGSPSPSASFTANVLTTGLSQPTINVIYSLLGINRRSSISFPTRASAKNENFLQRSQSPNSTGPENDAYRLNDLMTTLQYPQIADIPITTINEEDQAQLDSLVNLLNHQEQEQHALLIDDPNSRSWTGQDPWDSSSFDFDETPTDF